MSAIAKSSLASVVNPMVILFAIVAMTNLFSAPLGLVLDDEVFHELLFGLDRSDILSAYFWTVVSCGSLVLCYFAFGIHRDVRAYIFTPSVSYSEGAYRLLWFVSLAAGLLLCAYMFVQCDFRLPAVAAAGQSYFNYQVLRTHYSETINQNLYNITLCWIATANVVFAWMHLRGARGGYQLASLGLFTLVATFTLARSTVGLALLIVMNYRLLEKATPWRQLLTPVLLIAGVMLGTHYLAGAPEGYRGMSDYLGARVMYGQWTSLPYYFSLFDGARAGLSSVLPPVLQSFSSGPVLAPSRIVMMHMVPDAVENGSAGVASAFFVGEAFAVAGIPGVILAPPFVMVQVALITRSFRALPKTTLNVFMMSWFLFKIMTGVISGFSAFLFSSLQVMILLLVYWTSVAKRLTPTGAPVARVGRRGASASGDDGGRLGSAQHPVRS